MADIEVSLLCYSRHFIHISCCSACKHSILSVLSFLTVIFLSFGSNLTLMFSK